MGLILCLGETRGKMEAMKLHQIMFLPTKKEQDNRVLDHYIQYYTDTSVTECFKNLTKDDDSIYKTT